MKYAKNIDGLNNFFSSEIYQAYNKELCISEILQDSNCNLEKHNYDCQNGQIAYTMGGYEFTDADKQIMSEPTKLCLFKTFGEQDNCEDGLILDSSKKSGFECGYTLYTIQASEKTISYITCNIFNINYYAELVKLSIKSEFKKSLSETADKIAMRKNYGKVISFVVEYYNLKGQKMKYDSKTDQFTITISTPIKNKVPIKRKRKKYRGWGWKTVILMKKFKGLKRYRIIKRLEELKGLKN